MFKTLLGIYQQISIYLFKQELETSEQFLQFLVSKFNATGAVTCTATYTFNKVKLEVFFDGEYLFSIRTYNNHLFLFLCVGTLNTMTHPGLPSGIAASELCTLINDVCSLGAATITSHTEQDGANEIIEIVIPFSWYQLNCRYLQSVISRMQMEQRSTLVSAIQGMYEMHEEELMAEDMDNDDFEESYEEN